MLNRPVRVEAMIIHACRARLKSFLLLKNVVKVSFVRLYDMFSLFETDCGPEKKHTLCIEACKIPRSCMVAWRMPTSFQCLAPHHGAFLFQKDSVRRSPPIQKKKSEGAVSPYTIYILLLPLNRRRCFHKFKKHCAVRTQSFHWQISLWVNDSNLHRRNRVRHTAHPVSPTC